MVCCRHLSLFSWWGMEVHDSHPVQKKVFENMKDEVSNDNTLVRITGLVRQLLLALRIPPASTLSAERSPGCFFPVKLKLTRLFGFIRFHRCDVTQRRPFLTKAPTMSLTFSKKSTSAFINDSCWHLAQHYSLTRHTTSVWHMKREAMLIYYPWGEKTNVQ